MKSTHYHDQHAEVLSTQYNAIGAGSGRDANWLASMGWDVIAVEPNLNKLRSLGHRFDLILLSAVWMHVPPTSRERAFRILGELLKPSGVLVITLRHGSDEQENTQRDFHSVTADEVLEYAERGAIVTGAIRDACSNIAAMPARYITYPGQNRPVFESQKSTVRLSGKPVTLSRSFLLGFGTFRIPTQLWQTLGQYACWLEPAILREWSGLTQGWGIADYKSTDMRVFDWEEGRRDTSIAAGRITALHSAGIAVPCVWSARNVRTPHIDHCFPWARWLNNDLWNLLPASATVNSSKGGFSPLRQKFLLEVGSSLPQLADGEPGLQDIYNAMLHQRVRLKSDQQLVEWSVD